MFYKVEVQSVLSYNSKTWVFSKTAMAQLEGFHIQVACMMAKRHMPHRGPD
jgi:hypothetical protein